LAGGLIVSRVGRIRKTYDDFMSGNYGGSSGDLMWSRKSPTFPFIDVHVGFRALKFIFWLAGVKIRTSRDGSPIKEMNLESTVMKVGSESFMLAHHLFVTSGVGSKGITRNINDDTSLSQLAAYDLFYEVVGASDEDIAAVSDDDYSATKGHMVYPGCRTPASGTGGQIAFTGVVRLPQLQQEVMANRERTRDIRLLFERSNRSSLRAVAAPVDRSAEGIVVVAVCISCIYH
jgi:hypothetical protein